MFKTLLKIFIVLSIIFIPSFKIKAKNFELGPEYQIKQDIGGFFAMIHDIGIKSQYNFNNYVAIEVNLGISMNIQLLGSPVTAEFLGIYTKLGCRAYPWGKVFNIGLKYRLDFYLNNRFDVDWAQLSLDIGSAAKVYIDIKKP